MSDLCQRDRAVEVGRGRRASLIAALVVWLIVLTVRIAVLRERADGERRVAATPETVKKFIALGATVAVEAGAGAAASIRRRRLRSGRRDAGRPRRDDGRCRHRAGRAGARPGEPRRRQRRAPGSSPRSTRSAERARGRRLCRRRARGAGDGVDAAHHARAVDGHPVVAVESGRLQGGARRGGANMAAPFR